MFLLDITFHNEFGDSDGFPGLVVCCGLDLSSVLDLSVVYTEAVDDVGVALPDVGVES